MTDQTPSTENVPQFLTDEEWREFQAIPDQGYSHRHWVNHKIAKYAAANDRAVKAEALREAAVDGHRAFTEWVAQTPARNYLRGMSAVLTQDLHAMADRIEADRG